MFINELAEFSSADDPKHIISAEHKRLVREYLRGLAEEERAHDPVALSTQLNLLLEGAIVEAHVSGNIESAKLAKAMAEVCANAAVD